MVINKSYEGVLKDWTENFGRVIIDDQNIIFLNINWKVKYLSTIKVIEDEHIIRFIYGYYCLNLNAGQFYLIIDYKKNSSYFSLLYFKYWRLKHVFQTAKTYCLLI